MWASKFLFRNLKLVIQNSPKSSKGVLYFVRGPVNERDSREVRGQAEKPFKHPEEKSFTGSGFPQNTS